MPELLGLPVSITLIPAKPARPLAPPGPTHLPLNNILKSHLFMCVHAPQGICESSERSFESLLSFLMWRSWDQNSDWSGS